MRRALALLSALALAAPAAGLLLAPAEAADKARITDAQALAVVLADPRRDGDRIRDQYRHPAETLAFFKVRPGMTVVDFMPGGGWYTRILVPYLGERGRYIGLNPDVRGAGDGTRREYPDLSDGFALKAAGWTGVPAERIAGYSSNNLPDALRGKVDRVLLMREVHNLWTNDMLRRELAVARSLLRDDGLLGVEQHRARDKAPAGYTDGSNGYMRDRDVVALIEAAGFTLIGRSEINANPRDPANHARGVWMLPPGLSGVSDPAEKARLIAIGESDRMTLVFRKRK